MRPEGVIGVMQRSFAVTAALILVALASAGCLLPGEEAGYVHGTPGEFTREFLRDDPYPKLLIELDYVEGYNIDPQAKALLDQRINEVTDKQEVVWESNAFKSNQTKYSEEDLMELEAQHRTRYKDGDTAVLHIFYLNGEFAGEPGVIGVAYTGSSMVIFKEQITGSGTLFISDQDIEKAVIVHEFGHILALVNIGYVSQHDHEDPEHKGHSNNEPGLLNDGSVMYWQVDSTNFWNQFQGEPPNQFDSDDLDDLRGLKEGSL